MICEESQELVRLKISNLYILIKNIKRKLAALKLARISFNASKTSKIGAKIAKKKTIVSRNLDKNKRNLNLIYQL